MTTESGSFEKACADLHWRFFARFPNDELKAVVDAVLRGVVCRQTTFPGKVGGWAGGMVYLFTKLPFGIPSVLNAELAEAFGATMNTIAKRAEAIRQLIEPAPSSDLDLRDAFFTVQDEAKAICAFLADERFEPFPSDSPPTEAVRNYLARCAAVRLAYLLSMKRKAPVEYERFIRQYHRALSETQER